MRDQAADWPSKAVRHLEALFFIEHGTRRVHLAGCTSNPTGSWVTQRARNLGLIFAERRIRFLIRARDGKYTGPFDEVFRSERIRILRTPIGAPQANAVAERFVRSVRTEWPRLAADHQPSPPRAGAPDLCPALQRRAAAPRSRPASS
jgi:transposase InsO family protein